MGGNISDISIYQENWIIHLIILHSLSVVAKQNKNHGTWGRPPAGESESRGRAHSQLTSCAGGLKLFPFFEPTLVLDLDQSVKFCIAAFSMSRT